MPRTGDEIAIIGMAVRAPGAKNLDEFWSNIERGVESRVVTTDEDAKAAGQEAALANPNYVKAAFPVGAIEMFDAEFFGMSPKEAAVKDPQGRMCLELAWEALEHAGFDPKAVPGRTAVVLGIQPHGYLINNLLPAAGRNDAPDLVRFVHQGNVAYGVPLAVSYFLSLTGQSLAIDTACSSSL